MPATGTLSLVASTDVVLRQPAQEVTDIIMQVWPHIRPMFDLMKERHGIGLAAPQVGIPLRFFVTDLPGFKVVINPRIVSVYGGRTSKREGCLTWPGRETYVTRHNGIRVEYMDKTGATQFATLVDWPARVFQHETDHLAGVCIFK